MINYCLDEYHCVAKTHRAVVHFVWKILTVATKTREHVVIPSVCVLFRRKQSVVTLYMTPVYTQKMFCVNISAYYCAEA